MIQEAIFARLTAYAGLTSLVGTSPARIYYRILPQDPVYPAVTYAMVSAPREKAMGSDPGIVNARVQFDAWDNDPDSVRDVAEQIRKALERWRGVTAFSTTVQDTFIDNMQEPGPELVDSQPVFRVITDVQIFYTE